MLKNKQILLFLEWYDHRIHQGVAEVAREQGWQLIAPKLASDLKYLMEDIDFDGMITLLSQPDFSFSNSKKMPWVELGMQPQYQAHRVVTDNNQIAKLAAQHLISKGFKQAFALSPGTDPFFIERVERFEVHFAELGGHVHVLKEERICDKLLKQLEDFTGKNIKEQLLAFFALEDSRAADMISLCMHHDIAIPENIAVLGVDNDELIHQGLSIGLSSVDTHQLGLGRTAAQKLTELMNQPSDTPLTTTLHAPLGVTVYKSTDVLAVEDPLVSTALKWIKSHYADGIQAVDVAKMLGITQQTMQKAFSLHHNRTPAQEIRHHRIVKAEHELLHSESHISHIADLCGYSSVDTFINHFNRVHGQSPNQYRKTHLEL